jgi:hypothetical protein
VSPAVLFLDAEYAPDIPVVRYGEGGDRIFVRAMVIHMLQFIDCFDKQKAGIFVV